MNINGFSNDNIHTGDVRITGDLEVDGDITADGKFIIPSIEATTIETDAIQTLSSGGNLRFSDSAGVQAMKLYDGGIMGIGNTDGTDYKLPVADGTANQVLSTDGAGQMSFTSNPTFNITKTELLTTAVPGADLSITNEAGQQVAAILNNQRFRLGQPGNVYDFPLVDGTPGQLLTTDGAGSVSFSDIPATSDFVLAKKYTMSQGRSSWTSGFEDIALSGTGTFIIDPAELVLGNQVRITARGVYNGTGPGTGTGVFRFTDTTFTDDSAGITLGTGTYTNQGFWEITYTITPTTSNLAVYSGTCRSTNLPTGDITQFAFRSPITRSTTNPVSISILYSSVGYDLITTHYSIDIIKSLDLVGGAGGVGTTDHLTLTNLTAGDAGHTQFALLAGRSGGQSLFGGTASGNDLFLYSTSNATRGNVVLSDEVISNDIIPLATDTHDLGSTALQWNDIHMSSQLLNGDASGIITPTDRPLGIKLMGTGTNVVDNPTIELYSASSAYPSLQLNAIGNQTGIAFGCYRNGAVSTLISSNIISNYLLTQLSTGLSTFYNTGKSLGTDITTGLEVGTNLDISGNWNTRTQLPLITNTYDLGSSALTWNNAYIDKLQDVSQINMSGSDLVVSPNGQNQIDITDPTGSNGQVILALSSTNPTTATYATRIRMSGFAGGVLDFAVIDWKTVATGSTSNEMKFTINNVSPTNFTIRADGKNYSRDMNPLTTNTYDLGSSSFIWQNTHTSELDLYGSTSGVLGLKASNTTTSHALTFPSAQGASSTVLTNNGSGGLSWADTGSGFYFYDGDNYSTPLAVSAAATTVLASNGATQTVSSQAPLSGALWWNTTTNKIEPEFDGDSYTIEIRLGAETNNVNGYFSMLIDIGGGITIPLGVFTFPKGTGVNQSFSKTTQIFCLNTFKANGGEIKLTSELGTTTINSFGILISRSHRAH